MVTQVPFTYGQLFPVSSLPEIDVFSLEHLKNKSLQLSEFGFDALKLHLDPLYGARQLDVAHGEKVVRLDGMDGLIKFPEPKVAIS